MKKTLSLILALITLLLCLVGCNNSKDIVLTDEDIHTDYAGVYLTLSSVDDTGEYKKLKTVWHNETNKEYTFGEDFYIEILENDEWKSVMTEDMIVASIAHLLPAKATQEKTYSTEYFDLSKEGMYRIRCEFSPGEGKRYNTWVTFEVKEATLDKIGTAHPGGTDVHDVFDIRISWANWLDGTTVYEGCLNFDKMATSSSLHFDVNSIFNDGQSFCIYVNQTNDPEDVTDDMAGWFITVAVPKSATENCSAFDAIMGYGSKHSLTVIDESGHLVDVNAPKEYYAGEVVTLKGELVYDTYLTFYVDDVRIDVEQENVDNYLYYSFVMPSKDTTVVCKLVSVSPPPAPQ